MPDIARLSIEVTPKGIADAKRQLDQLATAAGHTQEKAGGMMGSFRNMQAVMQGPVAAFQAVTAVIGKVIAVGSELVNTFAESEQGIAKLEAVLNSTGYAAGLSSQEIQSLASEMQRLTLFEDDAVIAAQTVLLTFKQIGQDEFPRATRAAADMATVMGMDLQSAITLVGKALNEPVEGLSALRRVGVQLTDSQEAMIRTMMETNDIAGAQAVIMGELEGQFGGAAEAAADTATGSFVQFQNAIGDLKEELGALISEGIEPAARSLTSMVSMFATELKDMREAQEVLVSGGASGNISGVYEKATADIEHLTNSIAELRERMDNAVDVRAVDGFRDAIAILESQLNTARQLAELTRQAINLQAEAEDRAFSRSRGGQNGAAIPAGTPDAPAGLDERGQELVRRRIAAMEAARLDIAVINREMREGILSREEAENRIVTVLEREREALIRLDEEGMQSGTLEARLVAIKEILTQMAGLVGPVQQFVEYLNKGMTDLSDTTKGLGGPSENILAAAKNAEKLAAAYQAIQDVFPAAARDAFVDSFMALGDALYSGTNAGESLVDAMGDVLNQILNQLPMMLLNAGLMAISSGNIPVGIALVAASGLVALGAGFMNAAQSNSSSSINTSSATATQATASMADRSTKVEINNYSGATATATETTGPNGERQIKVLIESAVKAGMAQGRFDSAMGRFGVRPQGVRT